MSPLRKENLKMLLETLTDDQLNAVRMVIATAEVQGDYNCMDEDGGSYYCDDVSSTLDHLSEEFRR